MNLTQFRPTGPRPHRVEGSTALDDADAEALDVFDSETAPPRPPAPEPVRQKSGLTLRIAPAAILPIAVAALLGVIAGATGLWAYQRVALGRGASLRLETSVPGVEVLVSGKAVGRTPLSLTLAAGSYPVQLAGEGGRRDFTVDLARGTSVVRHVEMPAPVPAASALGSLHVQTEPGRLAVLVDGVERGTSPLTVAELTPGEHQVAVRGDGTTVRRTVTIQANERTVLVVSPVERATPSLAVSAAAGGWVSLASPVALVIKESGKVLGTTDAERLMLPAGEHTLELSNDSLGFQAKRTVRVEAGKSAVIKVEPPAGVLSINAQPWAEVWVDGQRIGETPIGNLARPIGQHEVVLRHPDLGERRETVTVTLRQPTRLGVDMRKK
jgi:PEGA domain-containing protein